MWLRVAAASALLSTTSLAPAAATTAIHSSNGVEVIVFERDSAPRIAPKPRTRPLAASRPAARTRAANTFARAAPVAVRPLATSPELRGATTLIATALSYVGTPYVWGGAAPGGFDCSGFTYYAFARLGIRIPRTADVQFAAGRPVAGDPLPGDLVFFQTYDYGASHVGIYLGNGRFVNSIGDNVHVATFGSTYFRERYIGARRFLTT